MEGSFLSHDEDTFLRVYLTGAGLAAFGVLAGYGLKKLFCKHEDLKDESLLLPLIVIPAAWPVAYPVLLLTAIDAKVNRVEYVWCAGFSRQIKQ